MINLDELDPEYVDLMIRESRRNRHLQQLARHPDINDPDYPDCGCNDGCYICTGEIDFDE